MLDNVVYYEFYHSLAGINSSDSDSNNIISTYANVSVLIELERLSRLSYRPWCECDFF